VTSIVLRAVAVVVPVTSNSTIVVCTTDTLQLAQKNHQRYGIVVVMVFPLVTIVVVVFFAVTRETRVDETVLDVVLVVSRVTVEDVWAVVVLVTVIVDAALPYRNT